MSDSNHSCNRSHGTTVELSTKQKIKDKCLISTPKSKNSGSLKSSCLGSDAFDLNEFNRDIHYLLALANNLNCKVENFRLSPPSSSELRELIKAVKGVQQSYESIRCFIKEDNINENSMPEYEELSKEIYRLQESASKIRLDSSLKHVLSNKTNLYIEETDLQTACGAKCCDERSLYENSVFHSCNMRLLNGKSEQSDDIDLTNDHNISERAEISTPFIEKFGDSENSNSSLKHSELEVHYISSQNKSSYNKAKSDISIETIGSCVFFILFAFIVMLYILSKLVLH